MPRKQIFSAEEVGRIHRILKRRFREAGPGTIKEIEATFGLPRDYYAYNRRQQTLDLGVLLATLRRLGSDPGEFFAELYGPGEIARSGAELAIAEPAGHRQPAGARTASPGLDFAAEDPSSRNDLEAWLSHLDDRRYDDPEASLDELTSRHAEIPRSLASHWLAVCASCHRMTGGLRDARLCLEAAEALLEPGDDVRRANLLQRSAYLWADAGRSDQALECVEKACGIYTRLGDETGVGQTLVEQSKFLFDLDRMSAAVPSAERGLRLLPEEDRRFRFTAHQLLSLHYTAIDQLDQALEHSARAKRRCDSTRSLASLLWSESRIESRRGDFDAASTKLARAVEILTPRFPLAGLLATAEHVRALAHAGRPARAFEVARQAIRFAALLKGNRQAEAAIADLFRLAHETGVEQGALQRIIHRLRAVRSENGSDGDSLGHRLIRARERLGIGRSETAEQLGMAVVTLQKIEAGQTPGTMFHDRIVDWLDRSAPELRVAQAIRRRAAG